MPVTYEQALAMRESLEADYSDRHSTHRQLRDFWHGKYWNKGGNRGGDTISSIFRDLRNRSSDFGPDVLLIHNVLQQVAVKYQTYLSPLPMIRVYTDPPESPLRRKQATLKERYLYGLWNAGNMAQVFNKASWYLPLMGDAFLGIWPDFDKKMPVPIIRSPEYAYPVTSFDGHNLDAILFSWKITEEQARRQWPELKYSEPTRSRFLPGPVRDYGHNPKVEILEYSDDNEFHRWVEGQEVNGVVHNFGFNIFDQMGFIGVPDEPWNHSAVEQAVNLVEMGNALYSLLFQAVYDNVFPKLVLVDPSKAPEEIDMGPGAVIPVNAGGSVEWLHPPVEAVQSQVGFLGVNEQNIKQATSMPDVNFGQFRSSIVTGKAINELQGAGTGSTVEMVQGLGLGDAVCSWNEKAIYMGQNMFADDNIRLFGNIPNGISDINPRNFALTLKGKELIGSCRNEVIFMPTLDMHEKVVMNLQLMGGDLVSKKYSREQIGIPDSEAMDEEIIGEKITAAVIGSIEQSLLQAGAQPQDAIAAEQQAVAYLGGQTNPPTPSAAAPTAPAGPALGAPPAPGGAPGGFGGGPPVGPIGPGAPGQALSPALQLPPGAPPPGGPPPDTMPGPQPQAPAGTGVALGEVAAAIRKLDNIKGKVYLVGQIVQEGSTSSDIEVAITETDDQQTITDGAQQYAGNLVFHVVHGPPKAEPYLDVSPGTSGLAIQNEESGEAPDLEAGPGEADQGQSLGK